MAATPQSVLKELKEGRYAPIYFLQGEEPFYIDKIAEYIEHNALDPAQRGFNQMILYGRDVDMNTILTNARRFPMMSDRQVVIVREAREIRDLGREAGQKLLESYIHQPQPSTILVFCHKHKRLDGRKNLAKVLQKEAVLVTTTRLYDNQLPEWITDFVISKGSSITTKAAFMLAENVGNDLERLSGEIEKILINFTEAVEIDENMVQKYVGISKEYNSFELQKSIATGNRQKTSRIVQYFIDNPSKNLIIPTIALLYTFFSRLLAMQSYRKQGVTGKALAGKLGVNPYFMKEYEQAAGFYGRDKIIRNITYLREADLRSKGIGAAMDQGQILQELIFKLMH